MSSEASAMRVTSMPREQTLLVALLLTVPVAALLLVLLLFLAGRTIEAAAPR